LRTQEEVDRKMSAPAERVPTLQKKLPNDSLFIIGKGVKEDSAAT
jgi:hypothetical protein